MTSTWCRDVSATLHRRGKNSPVERVDVYDADTIGHMRYTTRFAASYLLHVTADCVGATYQLRLTPAVQILPAAPVLDAFGAHRAR